MPSQRVRIDGVANVVKQIFEDYSQDIQEGIDAEAEKLANESRDELRSLNAPYKQLTGKYNKSWAVKNDNKDSKKGKYVSYKVHNKKYYQLTHLLEFGHVGKNQYGEWGYVKAYPHIGNIEKRVQEEFPKRIEEMIKRGGK